MNAEIFDRISLLAKQLEPRIIGWRRDLHRIPELGFELPKTSAYVEKVLRELGVENIRTGVCGSGIIAEIPGLAGPGKTAAFRADMDALPINEPEGLEFASLNPGCMHACGHDGHTAMLLGAAGVLMQLREYFPGTARLIFQPAEEGPMPGGAENMIRAGAAEGVDAIFCCHVAPEAPLGQIWVGPGPILSGSDQFKITVKGRGGHGSMPQFAVDSIACAARIVEGIQYIISRKLDPLEPACISFGSVHGGSAPNIIPGEVVLTGSIRTYGSGTREKVLAEMENCIRTSCEFFGAEGIFESVCVAPPLVNSRREAEIASDAIAKTSVCGRPVPADKPGNGSDDFAHYLQTIPGAYYRIGNAEGPDTAVSPHSPNFKLNEKILVSGAAAHAAVLMEYLCG